MVYGTVWLLLQNNYDILKIGLFDCSWGILMADYDKTFARFEALATSIKDALETAMRMVGSGIAPMSEDIDNLYSDMQELRIAYDEARSFAISDASPDDIMEDGLPIQVYRDAAVTIERERLFERIAPIIEMLRKFCSVTSDTEAFEEALKPFKKTASESLQALRSLSAGELEDLGDIDDQYKPQRVFVQALECDDLSTTVGIDLLDMITQSYPTRVQQGVALRIYRFGEYCDAGLEGKKGNIRDGASVVPTETNGHAEQDAVSTVKEEFHAPYPHLNRPKRTGSSSFKKLLLKSPNLVVALTFAALARFRCMTIEALQRLAVVVFGKDESLSPDAVTLSASYLAQKGIIEKAGFEFENSDAFVLSEDGCQLARKDSVINMMNSHSRSTWFFPYVDAKRNIPGCDPSASSMEMLAQNDVLLSFLESSMGSGHKLMLYRRLQGCYWDGNHYVIQCEVGGSRVEGILARRTASVPEGATNAFVLDVPSDEERFACGVTHLFVITDSGIQEVAKNESASSQERLLSNDKGTPNLSVEESGSINSETDQTISAKEAHGNEQLSAGVAQIEQRADDSDGSRRDNSSDPSTERISLSAMAESILRGNLEISDEIVTKFATRLMEEIPSDDGADSLVNLETALTLLKSVHGQVKFGHSSALYEQVSLAVNSPLECEEYTGANIKSTFPTYSKENEGFVLAAYCLALLAPKHSYDHELYKTCESYLNSFDTVFPSFSRAKPLFSELINVCDILPEGGFTSSVLAGIGGDVERRRAMDRIRAKAKTLLRPPKFNAKMSHLPVFSQICFGSNSDLSPCLDIIVRGREDKAFLVEKVFEAYCVDGKLSDRLIESLIDNAWSKAINAKGNKGPRRLAMESRRKASDEIYDRLGLMEEWLEHVRGSVNESEIEEIREIRDSLLTLSDEIISMNLFVGQQGGGTALHTAVREIKTRLSGSCGRVLTFSDFLRTGLLPTGVDGLPVVEGSLCNVSHCEPWKAVLRHYIADKPSFTDVKNQIGDDDSPMFDNLSQLFAISKMVDKAEAVEPSKDIKTIALQSAEAELAKFNDQLEIAFTYNRINEVQKEDLASYAREFKNLFYSVKEYGCWREFLRALFKQVDDLSADHSFLLEERLASCRGSISGGDSTLLDEAEKLLREDKNLTVVEEYLNRFESGERQLTEKLRSGMSEQDDFARFISGEFYQTIFDVCRKYKGRPLASYGINFTRKRYPKSWTERQKKNSESLVQNWPVSQKRQVKDWSQNIGELFKGLGFSIKGVAKPDSIGREIYRLEVRPVSRDRESYDHPISAFGTQMNKKIEVLVLYGNQTPQDIIRAVVDSGLSNCSFVLVNYSISLSDRRTLAELYHKRQASMPSFLVIDQVLILFLALNESATRLSVMLKCTLPFTSYQPFVRDGGATADEMFCGREEELRAITNPSGAGVVYGGRQLGKTALLQRARSLCNKPDKGEYAVYVSILQCDTEQDLISTLASAASRAGLDFNGVHSIVDLCDRIREILADRAVSKVLLLIDEADNYLASISSEGYLPLQPLVELRRESENKFKFVLAGLHNVSRAKNATTKNGIFGQLGSPLCIRPLSPAEALRLISRPLMFLGFQVDRYPHLETILTSTNYYPGILQFFGNILVETMSSQYSEYYRAQDGNPPYSLTKEQLGAIMSRTDLNNSIKEKFRLSLELDPRYFMIARCIALLYYEAEESGGEGTLAGYSPTEVKHTADEWDIKTLADESASSFGNLMDEMVDMYILAKPDQDTQRYRLRRHAFLSIIGKDADMILDDIANNDA